MGIIVSDNLKETASAARKAYRLAPPASPLLQVSLWLMQFLLAFAFSLSGMMKAFTPISELALNVPWAADLPVVLVRFIGTAELAGAAGLLVPALTRIRPVLTAWAAVGLALVMALAVAFHIVRGETAGAAITALLGAMAAFIAWGRSTRAPIEARD
jgi:putative oxidoreductase